MYGYNKYSVRIGINIIQYTNSLADNAGKENPGIKLKISVNITTSTDKENTSSTLSDAIFRTVRHLNTPDGVYYQWCFCSCDIESSHAFASDNAL